MHVLCHKPGRQCHTSPWNIYLHQNNSDGTASPAESSSRLPANTRWWEKWCLAYCSHTTEGCVLCRVIIHSPHTGNCGSTVYGGGGVKGWKVQRHTEQFRITDNVTVLQHRSLQNWVPCHTARSVQPCFEEQDTSVGQADPKSWPTSNKHLWDSPEHRIWYWLARLSLWKLLLKLCQRNGEQSQHSPTRHLWKSEPKRIAAFITAKGGPTMYRFWLITGYCVPWI